jgi:putative peptidoglycan lipid II flippase
VSQINLLLDTVIASFLMTGSISWLYYSDRLMEFPLGLFGIAIATIILPALSRDHVSQDKQAFAANMDWAVKMVVTLGIPSALGLIILAEPLLSLIFERGAFTANDVSMAAMSLVAYSAGLLSFMLIKIFAPGFYAQQDTKTPVKFGIIAMASNMVFNLIFAIPYGYVGLAIATSLSGTLNMALLYYTLAKRNIYRLSPVTVQLIIKVLLASALMVAALWYAQGHVTWAATAFTYRLGVVSGYLSIALVVFATALYVFGVRPAHFSSPAAVPRPANK